MAWVFLHTLLGVIANFYSQFSSHFLSPWDISLSQLPSICTTGDTGFGVVSTVRSQEMSLSSHQLPVHWSSHIIRKSRLEFLHVGCHVSCVKEVSSTVLSWEHIYPNWKSIGMSHNSTVLYRCCRKVTEKCTLLVMVGLPTPLHTLASSVSCPLNDLCPSLSAPYSCFPVSLSF